MNRSTAIEILESMKVKIKLPSAAVTQRERNKAINLAVKALEQPEIIRCKDCLYYDPPHVEDNGKRREYKDMPDDAFDELETGLVNINYGVNVGGRCLRDYNSGYSDDKRVFVPETNYCGRAERRKKQEEGYPEFRTKFLGEPYREESDGNVDKD